MPDQLPWQLTKKPHEWLAELQDLHQKLQTAVHSDPNNRQNIKDLLQGIEDANEALKVYDESESGTWSQLLNAPAGSFPTAGGGEENIARLRGGVESIVGGVKSGLNTASRLLHAPFTGAKDLGEIYNDPIGAGESAADAVQNAIESVANKVRHPIRLAEESTPEEIGGAAEKAGELLVPFSKASGAIDLSSPLPKGIQGPEDAISAAPSVGGAVARGVGRLGKAVARAPGSLTGFVENWMNKPAVMNTMNRAQTTAAEEQAALAAARRTGVEQVNTTINPLRAQQAAQNVQNATTRGDILQENLGRQPTINAQQAERLKLLEQQSSRGGPTSENLDLRNEILRMRAEIMKNAQAGGGGLTGQTEIGDVNAIPNANPFPNPNPSEESGLFTNPEPIPGTGFNTGKQFGQTVEGPPKLRTMTPADNAFSAMRSGTDAPMTKNPFEQPQVQFEEGLPAARVSTLPRMSNADIESYLRQIQQSLLHGYGPK